MKNLLFVSQSVLSLNLLLTVLPLVSKKISIEEVRSLDEALSLPKKAKSFQVILFDYNVFKDDENFAEKLKQFENFSRLKKGKKILLFPNGAGVKTDSPEWKGFDGFYTKPFLPDELAGIIEKGVA